MNFYKEMTSRNAGTLTENEQEILRNSCVAVAGTGGVGGLLAERLVRIGIGNIRIADPEAFDHTNLNRQYGSDTGTIGQNKAATVAVILKKINPGLNIECYDKGIRTRNDASKFADNAAVVVDGMDYGMFRENIWLQQQARANNAHYLFSSSLGFGAIVANFDPKGPTLEQFMGMSEIDIEGDRDITQDVDKSKVVPYLPDYLHRKVDAANLAGMVAGEMPVSVNCVGAGLNAIMVAGEVVNILIRNAPITTIPNYTYIDLFEKKCEIKSFV